METLSTLLTLSLSQDFEAAWLSQPQSIQPPAPVYQLTLTGLQTATANGFKMLQTLIALELNLDLLAASVANSSAGAAILDDAQVCLGELSQLIRQHRQQLNSLQLTQAA